MTSDGRGRHATRQRAISGGYAQGAIVFGFWWSRFLRRFIQVPERGAVIRELFAAVDVGRTLPEIRVDFNAREVPGSPWSLYRLATALRRSAYRGEYVLRLRGETFVRRVEPIVAPALWERVQHRLPPGPSPRSITPYLHWLRAGGPEQLAAFLRDLPAPVCRALVAMVSEIDMGMGLASAGLIANEPTRLTADQL